MDPLDRLEAAIAQTRPIIAGTPASSYGEQTPCPDWDVRALINHVLGGLTIFYEVGTKGAVDPAALGQDLIGEDAAASYDAIGARAVAAWRVRGLEGTAVLPFGEFPAAFALQLPAMDVVVHGWDLATATGQDVAWDDGLIAETTEFVTGMLASPEMRGHDFGPPVEVPADAPAIDQLVGFLGRQPAVRS